MRGFTAIALLAVIAMSAVHAFSVHELTHQEWEAFKTSFGKQYINDVEESFRMKIYLENRRKIAVHNKDAGHPYRLSMNSFGDLLPHEFLSVRNGLKMPKNRTLLNSGAVTFLSPANVKVPDSLDWRKKGYVTPVKDQKKCGSCWAFSATGALEGQIFRKTGKLVSLSEQNLVDCSRKFGNQGCDGGLPQDAFNYIKSNNGIDTEKSYPYEAQDDVCRYKRKNKGGYDNGFVAVKEGDEKMLKTAVATVGPISIAIDASQQSLQFYSEGIYNDDFCSSTDLDHAVLLVGYGTDNGEDYWIIKNSWSETWGENGYIRIIRNKDNMCGVATLATYPIV